METHPTTTAQQAQRTGSVESKTAEAPSTKECTADDLVRIVKDEHNHIKALWEEYQSSKDAEVKQKKACEIHKQFVSHISRDEQALFPAMREIKSLGDAHVEKAKSEHQVVTEDLAKLHKLKYADSKAEFDALLGKLMKEMGDHINDVETRVLPLFVKECPKEKAGAIVQAYKSAVVKPMSHEGAEGKIGTQATEKGMEKK